MPKMPTVVHEESQLMGDVVITAKKIRNKIANLKLDSAPGLDGIITKLLKTLGNRILEPLEIIFRKSVRKGKSTDRMEKSNSNPHLKKGRKRDHGNYV